MTHYIYDKNQDFLFDFVDKYWGYNTDRAGHYAVALCHKADNDIDAIIVFSPYDTDIKNKPLCMECKIITYHKRVFTRKNLRAIFSYPFIHVGVKRLETLSPSGDNKIQSFNQKLGFTQEGILRSRLPDGRDACINSMMFDECKWIKPSHGFHKAKNTSST